MYSEEQETMALHVFHQTGSVTDVVRRLGSPSRKQLYTWICNQLHYYRFLREEEARQRVAVAPLLRVGWVWGQGGVLAGVSWGALYPRSMRRARRRNFAKMRICGALELRAMARAAAPVRSTRARPAVASRRKRALVSSMDMGGTFFLRTARG